MEEKRITEMDAEEFGQLINDFIDRETNVNNLRFVIQLVNSDAVAASD